MGGCSEEIGGLFCIAFKPVKKDRAVILDTTVSTGREKVWVTEDTMGIPTLVTVLFGTRSEVRWFLSPATEVSGLVWETKVGIPTLKRVRYGTIPKGVTACEDLNGLNSIILQFEQKIINKYTVNYLKLQ